jgi:hypothetical protein
MRSKEWLEDPAGVQVPDSDTLHADACGPSYRYDSHTRLVLERKEDMRRRGVPSPDEWDAVALTFAEPVGPANFRRRIEYPRWGLREGIPDFAARKRRVRSERSERAAHPGYRKDSTLAAAAPPGEQAATG